MTHPLERTLAAVALAALMALPAAGRAQPRDDVEPAAAVPLGRDAPTAGAAQSASRAALVRALIELDARDLDGNRWTFERLRGRVVLVDFWASWCAPCLRELPYLRRARARYGDHFEILGISLDRMPAADLRGWLRAHDVDWPQIHAPGSYQDPLARAFGIDRLPTNLLLGRDGRLQEMNVRGEALFAAVDRLVR